MPRGASAPPTADELFGPTGTPRVVVIGAGFGGIAAGVKLQRAGIETFTIYESSDGVGGTWWDNTYPGAEVDVDSNLYRYSFKPHDWSRTHAAADGAPGVPGRDGRRVRAVPAPAAGRHRPHRRAGTTTATSGPSLLDSGDGRRVPRPDQRGRIPQRAQRSRLARTGRIRGPDLPHRPLGPRPGPDRARSWPWSAPGPPRRRSSPPSSRSPAGSRVPARARLGTTQGRA